jgi:hypothetical protein
MTRRERARRAVIEKMGLNWENWCAADNDVIMANAVA